MADSRMQLVSNTSDIGRIDDSMYRRMVSCDTFPAVEAK